MPTIKDAIGAASLLLGDEPTDDSPPVASDDSVAVLRKIDLVRVAIQEQERRRIEALTLYEPLPVQMLFHQSTCKQKVIRGSNRSGKTLANCVEVARAVTGRDPHKKYPERDGRCYIVALDMLAIGQVLFRKLFRAGAIKMIRDEQTGLWRAFRPWEPGDFARKKQAKLAPPLIPERFIESIAWEDKGKGIPKLVRLTTGWEITFFSSQAEPPRGADLDLVAFDEELENEEWYAEMVLRLLDRSGTLLWSATPQAGNDKLLELSELAERERALVAADPTHDVLAVEFVSLLDENPHIAQADKDRAAAVLNKDDVAVRIGGEFAVHGLKVYPEFRAAVHCRPVDIPSNWTKYAAIDPGHQVCAVLFAAVPPPDDEAPFEVAVYRELYLRNCSADVFGEKMAAACRDEEIETFIIDMQMGRQTEVGSGVTVVEQYRKALEKHKVKSRRTGHGFVAGHNDSKSGAEMVRSYLAVNPETECPRVVFAAEVLPNFVSEIKRYRNKRVGRVVTDEPNDRGETHAMACLRYLLCHKLSWRKPTGRKSIGGVYEAFMARQAARRQKSGDGFIRLGPRPSA